MASQLTAPWASFYGDSPGVQMIVLFGHLAGILVGGGIAMAADRGTLRALRGTDDERARHLRELGLTHRPVVTALALAAVTGLLMLAADVETFTRSTTFWIKMALLGLLITNGYVMLRIERALGREPAREWDRLRQGALASVVLWLALLLAGTWLTTLT